MAQVATHTAATRGRFKATRKAKERPVIQLPDGRIFEPRQQWAQDVGITNKTASTMGLPTIFAGNVAYVDRDASYAILLARRQRKLTASATGPPIDT